MTEPRTYIIANTSEHRLSILRVGDTVYLHSNDRVIGFDEEMANEVIKGLMAVVGGAFDRAVTESHLRLEAERAARPSRSDSAPTPRPGLDLL